MKSRKTYKILTAFSFMFPMNRWYLGNSKGWLLRSISLNLLLMGYFGDLMYMNKAFDEAMTKRGYVNTNARNGK